MADNVPKIRFPGFTEPWEQRKLGDYIHERRERTIFEDEDRLISCAINGIFLNSELFSHFRGKSNIGYLKIKKNDLILSAQNLHLGNANVNLRFQHGIISPAYKVYSLVDVNPEFMQTWVKREETKSLFLKATTEGASQCRKNIDWDRLYKQLVLFPGVSEQSQIGSFFSQLDDLITLHQRKLDDLKKFKSGLLQKMFPKAGETVPEVRFPEFTGDWEQRKLGEIGNTFSGLSGKTKEDFGHGQASFVTYLNVFNNSIGQPNMIEKVEIDPKQFQVKQGDILFTTSSETPDEVGMACVWPVNLPNLYLNSFCFGFRPKKEIDINFYAHMLRSPQVRNQITLLAQGISRYNISKTKMMDIRIWLPSESEQRWIGRFLGNIDNLITLHQRKLDDLKKLKQGLLQQMFV